MKLAVESASFSPDGGRIVTASGDGAARLWDASSGSLIAALEGHEGPVESASFSPDGGQIVTACRQHGTIVGCKQRTFNRVLERP